MQTDVVLELDAVTRTFGRLRAVDGITEQFRRGEYFCILGPSGCGKTTLLRLIAGFERPDEGRIRLHGTDITTAPPERRDLNVVFQNYALFPHLSTWDNVAFGLRMKKLPRAKVTTRVRDALQLVHLEQEAERLPRQLSGGQQQRVALARALVNRPAVLLLDEPLSALDQSMRARMQTELRRIQRESGVAFVHITHDQGEALTLADRIGVMRAGRFEQVATPHDVYRAPANAFVASFVGANNLLRARIRDDGHAELSNGATLPVCTDMPAGADALLAVRPHQLRVGADGALRGVVTGAAFTGGQVDVVIELDGGECVTVALDAATDVPAIGARVCADADPRSILVLPQS